MGSEARIPENFENGVRYGLTGLKYAQRDDAKSLAFFNLVLGMSYYNLLQFDSSLHYFRIAAGLSDQSGQTYYIVWANNALLSIYMQQQQYKEAEQYQRVLQSIADTTTDRLALTRACYGLGTYYFYRSYYNTSQEYLMRGLEEGQRLLDTTSDNRIKKEYAVNYYLLYKIYYNTQLYKKGMAALKKGSKYMSASPLLQFRYLSAFVDAYTMDNEYGNIDTALKYYHILSRQPIPVQKGIPSEVVTSALNIGQYYMNHYQLATAAPYIQRGDSLAALSKSPFLIHQVQNVQGRFAYFSGAYDKAIALLEESSKISKTITKGNYIECLTYIAKSYKAKGNLKKALEYFELVIAEKDSFNAETLAKNVADLEIQHSTKEKENEIVSLSNKNKVKELELRSEGRLRFFLLISLGILSLILILIYRFYRNKEKLNKILNDRNKELDTLNARLATANDTKTKLFGIFSHDLRSPISRIAQFLRLQKENPGLFSESARSEYHEQFTVATAHLLDTMEDLLLWSKSQMQNFNPECSYVNCHSLVSKESGLLRSQLEERGLSIQNHLPVSYTMLSDENFISIILRNLLQNAVKYSKEHSTVEVTADNSALIISNDPIAGTDAALLNKLLKNNGVSSQHFGLGLHIVNDLAEKINVDIRFEDENGRIKSYIIWAANPA